MIRQLLLATLWCTDDRGRAQRSALIWADRGDGAFRLTPLGLLNTVLLRFNRRLYFDRPLHLVPAGGTDGQS